MSKPFDTVMKSLLDQFAIDWVSWLAPQVGLPRDVQVTPHHIDLSTVQVTADKVFQLQPPAQGFLHLEPQSSWDASFPLRLACYNLLIELKSGGPVHTVAMLLRREANSPALTGTCTLTHANGEERLRFRYGILKVWELEPEELLQGPLGAAPLALLADGASANLQSFVDRLDERVQRELSDESERSLLLVSSYILLGLRYDDGVIQKAFSRVSAMRESSTYQAILHEGELKGRQEGELKGRQEGELKGRQLGQAQARRDSLLEILREKFGTLPNTLESQLQAIDDVAQLQQAIKLAVRISSLEQFHL